LAYLRGRLSGLTHHNLNLTNVAGAVAEAIAMALHHGVPLEDIQLLLGGYGLYWEAASQRLRML
jgi:hypothetical protein